MRPRSFDYSVSFQQEHLQLNNYVRFQRAEWRNY